MLDPTRALVLLSGGQDSATCLAWALERFQHVETIGFRYGQRHAIELNCRQRVLDRLRAMRPDWGKRLRNDHIVDVSVLGEMSQSALTKDIEIAIGAQGLPTTFVPGRNLVFLVFAAITAYRRGTKHLVTGVCETDFSGYPDCRDDTIKAMQLALNLGMASQFVVHTPLMWRDKANTWTLAEHLGGSDLVELIRDESHTCYYGNRESHFDWGFGCGLCPACELRKAGWEAFIASRVQARVA